MPKLTLSKPLTYEGADYTELEYDLDALTGDDLLIAETQVVEDGVLTPLPLATGNYQAAVFARAAKAEYGLMRKLSAKDFIAATQVVKVFLNDSV